MTTTTSRRSADHDVKARVAPDTADEQLTSPALDLADSVYTDAATETLDRARGHDEDIANTLLTLLAELPAGHPDRRDARDQLVMLYMPLAKHFARRMCRRGDSLDDLSQVAAIGLIKAVDGFDITRGAAFLGYAVPTIVGEIKRYFRDKGWSVRVPRRLQELKLELAKATDALAQENGELPHAAELAAYLGTTEAEVNEGIEAASAYSTISLQSPMGGADGQTAEIADLLGDEDPELELVEYREALHSVLGQLPEREQRMIALRFFGNRTQSEIAEELGISQMHVSRLLTSALGQLRTALTV